ncbi:hypothetical protein A2164_03675 [Candidatus Curtissbacteria bacterium RBG_13_35_7]|uniref:Cupin type-2 domain-containing protein n=1 Tax=Candidatus Curtissbacteria bacterium RBG_13_35_7 TaxID=1797705 RepID=A0A1F5G3Q3_9BACT|nr:MAG: hypothetical protein A2164_03675 [Candidatus Curtissbacteria bacterium RBG_13_35_7]
MLSIVKTKHLIEESLGAVSVKNLFSDHDYKQISVAILKVQGVNRMHVNTKSDEFHFVLNGDGSYTVDNDIDRVSEGDLVHIPKNMPFSNSGQMTLLVFTSPSYDPDAIEYLE